MPRRTEPAEKHIVKPHFKLAARRARARRTNLPRFRLLPLTMIMATLLFSLKAVETYQGGKMLQLQWQRAYAEEEAPEKAEEAAAGDETAAQDAGEEADDVPVEMANLDKNAPAIDSREFSQIELDLLQSLRERRKEIEARARELDLKEKLLEGTELRINDKIAEIKALETRVSALLERYSEQEESHIRSLVKIYESMKPKSAAVIFNELELPILLEVIDEMSERKVAPILAAMNPMKAKEVTSDLAEMRRLQAEGLKR